MTVAAPVTPVIVCGPTADRVQAVALVVAPVAPLSTTLTRVSCGCWAVLVIVQETVPPFGTTTLLPATVAPVQVQALAV